VFSIVPDFGSALTNTKPDIVLIEANRNRLGTAVSMDSDLPWQRFIENLGQQHLFRPHHLSRVRQVWAHIRNHVGPRLPLPVTQPTPDGAIQLYWDIHNKYLELDVYADGTLHWFFKDRASSERDGTEDDPVRGVPSHLLRRLVSLLS
jgi:hypothetical protein